MNEGNTEAMISLMDAPMIVDVMIAGAMGMIVTAGISAVEMMEVAW
jgi:hypothetical protein